MTEPPTDPAMVEVELLEIPLALRDRAQEHSDELLREMTLIALQIHEGAGDTLPVRLTRLAAEAQSTYGAFAGQPNADFDAAAARDETVVARVVYTVPRTIGPFVHHLIEILEETEEFCRQGTYLLALASPPELHGYRIWALREFERQLDGRPPLPWPRYAADHGLLG